jgi:hypothetical protein
MGDERHSEKRLTKVLFRVLESDGSSNVETLWAFDLGSDRYELDNCPFYAYGVSWRDIVFAPHDETEGFPTFRSIVVKSGNRTVRVIFEQSIADANVSNALLEGLSGLGCDFERATAKYVAVNVPPRVDLRVVVNYLIEREVKWEHADPTYEDFHAAK